MRRARAREAAGPQLRTAGPVLATTAQPTLLPCWRSAATAATRTTAGGLRPQ